MTDKEEQAARIIQLIDDTEYDYHVMPHHGMIPDWYLRYWELANLIRTYLSLK